MVGTSDLTHTDTATQAVAVTLTRVVSARVPAICPIAIGAVFGDVTLTIVRIPARVRPEWSWSPATACTVSEVAMAQYWGTSHLSKQVKLVKTCAVSEVARGTVLWDVALTVIPILTWIGRQGYTVWATDPPIRIRTGI